MDNFKELIKAFEKEEKMKTKHLKRKAEKKKVTRGVKVNIAKNVEAVKRSLRQRLDNATSHELRNVASHCELACQIKKLKGQIRQILS